MNEWARHGQQKPNCWGRLVVLDAEDSGSLTLETTPFREPSRHFHAEARPVADPGSVAEVFFKWKFRSPIPVRVEQMIKGASLHHIDKSSTSPKLITRVSTASVPQHPQSSNQEARDLL